MKQFFITLTLISAILLWGTEFRTDGTFVGKAGTLRIRPNDLSFHYQPREGFSFIFYMEYLSKDGKFNQIYRMKHAQVRIDSKSESVFANGIYLADNKNGFPFSYTLSLSTDKKRVRLRIIAEKKLSDLKIRRRLCVKVPFRTDSQQRVELDAKRIELEKEDSEKAMVSLRNGNYKELRFFSLPGNYDLKIYPPDVKWSFWKQNREEGYYCGFFIPLTESEDTVFEFDIDTPVRLQKASSNFHGGVDFSTDKLCLPDYSSCRNMIQNPSFELDFDFWQQFWHGNRISHAPPNEFYFIDSTTAFKGNKSLRINCPANLFSASLSPFAIPVDENETLTLSFYAKTDKPGIANLFLMGNGIDRLPHSPFQYNFRPEKEWKRFSHTFLTKSKMLIFAISSYKPSESCTVWLDCIQLERGKRVSEYVGKNFSVSLRTADRSNIAWDDVPFQANLEIIGEHVSGKLKWGVTDFFGTEVMHGEKEIHGSSISLPELDSLLYGSFVLKVEISGKWISHHRLVRLHDMSADFRNRRIFGVAGGGGDKSAAFRRQFAVYGKTGVGTMLSFTPYWDEAAELLRKNHIQLIGNIFPDKILGKYSVARTRKENESISGVKDSELPQIEKEVYELAKKNPYVKIWKICNEPHLTLVEMKRALHVFDAARRGLLKAIPDAGILTPEPTNITLGGRNEIRDWLDLGCRASCDLPATHTYGSPDYKLDQDIRAMLDMLSSRMPGKKLWLTEGIYYTQYHLPDLKLFAYYNNILADHFSLGSFSYDIGQGERAGLANSMRSRLVSLKYAEKLGCDIDWELCNADRPVLGYDGIPKSVFFSINTLAYLLGNAGFVSDIELGEGVLGYLFEDDQKRPVAVLWNYDPEVLSGGKKGNTLNLSRFRGTCEIFDLFGNRRNAGKNLHLSGYPVFVRGEADRTGDFINAFGFPEICDAPYRGIRLFRSFSENGRLNLSIENCSARKIAGELIVFQDGKKILTEKCELGPKASRLIALNLEPDKYLASHHFNAEFKTAKQTFSASFELAYVEIRPVSEKFSLDGDLSEWKKHPCWKLVNRKSYQKNAEQDSDSGAEMYVAWDFRNLYLAFRVRDDRFFPVLDLKKSWTGDGIQLYFDSLADAGFQTTSGYNGDDQSYQIGFYRESGVAVYRDHAPDTQQAFVKRGMVNGVKGAFRKTKDGWNLEVVFPYSELEPVRLRENAVFGMSAVVNDNDGKGRKQAFFLNSGGEASQQPLLYPVFILKGNSK